MALSLFGLTLPTWITLLRSYRLKKEIILSHCVRVNHELFTEWIISQLHTEWCDAWRDENSALCWHHSPVITQWKSCYLQTLLKLANSCCLCGAVSLSDFLSLSFSGLPWEFVCLFFGYKISSFIAPRTPQTWKCVFPGKVSLQNERLWF